MYKYLGLGKLCKHYCIKHIFAVHLIDSIDVSNKHLKHFIDNKSKRKGTIYELLECFIVIYGGW